MAGFVLIHGAFHGGWCFDPVVAILRERGHEAVAPDLPGMGGSEAAMRAASLPGWAEFTAEHCRALRRRIGGAPLVLAGHSRGGPVISAAAEADPEAMDALVYICAMMIPPAATPEMMVAISPSGTGLLELTTPVENGAGMRMDGSRAGTIFAQLSPPALAEAAMARLAAEPIGPMMTVPEVTAARWGTVPRHYVECLHDRAIPHANQRAMITLCPGTATVTLEADHSPFFSAPEALADALIAAAEQR
jgi:pimeloyl-ACP methyl ester carboxylesterase